MRILKYRGDGEGVGGWGLGGGGEVREEQRGTEWQYPHLAMPVPYPQTLCAHSYMEGIDMKGLKLLLSKIVAFKCHFI